PFLRECYAFYDSIPGRSIIMQATHPKAGFRPQAASIGSGRKSMRDRQLRQNWKVNDGRAAALRRSEESRERHRHHGTYGKCATASKQKKRPPIFNCRERSRISAMSGHLRPRIGLTGGSKNDEFGSICWADTTHPLSSCLPNPGADTPARPSIFYNGRMLATLVLTGSLAIAAPPPPFIAESTADERVAGSLVALRGDGSADIAGADRI